MADPSSSITVTRRAPATLTARDRDTIASFVTRFIAYPRERLDAVIDAADYVWLCHDGGGWLIGTTAVRRIEVWDGGRRATVIYTAMVAVDPAHRRRGLIPRMGLQSYLHERVRAPRRPIHWLSLSASPSAYLQMARNFTTFWPRRDQETPAAVKSVLEQALSALGLTRVERVEGCYRLTDDFGVLDRAQDPARWDRSDPDIDFFLRVNPGYQRGSDLACLCPLSLPRLVGSALRQAFGATGKLRVGERGVA